MNIDEMRVAIKKHCNGFDIAGISCDSCALGGIEGSCFGDTADIKGNYGILFGCNETHGKPAADPVNHPTHYTQGGIECIDAIRASMTTDEYDGFLKGQVIKYVWRYKHKGKPAEDLKKAMFYLDRLIKQTEGVPESADK